MHMRGTLINRDKNARYARARVRSDLRSALCPRRHLSLSFNRILLWRGATERRYSLKNIEPQRYGQTATLHGVCKLFGNLD